MTWDVLPPLPIPPGWREHVKKTIKDLERRAAGGEEYARLALPGWYVAMQRIRESDDGNPEC